ncbi:MAG: carboxypeptidase Taq [Gaiellaceae bacterium]|jgi:carboxypeptidase Taq|nr:carboxypeptidase Taq [Gaiellaceae bacterium]
MGTPASAKLALVSAPSAYEELRTHLGEVADLRRIGQILFWDQQVMMPSGGAPARAEQSATLARISHEAFISPEIGRLLEELTPWAEGLDPESDEASIVRVSRRDWEKARRVPAELSAEMNRASSLALRVWAQARATSDFASLIPSLERNFELRRRYVECFEPAEETYDILLDDYEPGMKTAEVRAVFDRMKPVLIEIVRNVEPAEDALAGHVLPRAAQTAFALDVLERFGYDPKSWRLDPTQHPFASSPSTNDIRLTTHYDESSLRSVFAAMHEFGHGLYEHGVDGALARTPLGSGASMALHESQSRMWENLVGRSRPFWRFFYPRFRAAFTDLDLDEETLYRTVNLVTPTFIRVDADEVTYSLHVILRFELEQELVEGRLALADLPEAWNARFKEYLGLDVPNDDVGVLQDMHWAAGHIGYFPTYALGNVASVQIWDRIVVDLPDLQAQFEAGEFSALRDWLREHLYRLGRKFTPVETLERVTGARLDPEPYLRYLRDKYAA